jgi:hypothetical protein
MRVTEYQTIPTKSTVTQFHQRTERQVLLICLCVFTEIKVITRLSYTNEVSHYGY